MTRREFRRSVRVEIIKRACDLREDGQPSCENCGAIGVHLEVHHLDMDAMQVDKSKPLTARDGAFWCDDCHDPETSKQRKELAKVQAVEARHLGADKSAHPMRAPDKKTKAPLATAPGPPGWARRFK